MHRDPDLYSIRQGGGCLFLFGLPFFLTDPGGVIRRLDPGMKKDQAPKFVPGSLRRIPRGSLSGLVVGQI